MACIHRKCSCCCLSLPACSESRSIFAEADQPASPPEKGVRIPQDAQKVEEAQPSANNQSIEVAAAESAGIQEEQQEQSIELTEFEKEFNKVKENPSDFNQWVTVEKLVDKEVQKCRATKFCSC